MHVATNVSGSADSELQKLLQLKVAKSVYALAHNRGCASASNAEDARDCYMNMHVHMTCMLPPMYQAAQIMNCMFVAS